MSCGCWRKMMSATRSADCTIKPSDWRRSREIDDPNRVKNTAVLTITETASLAASPSRTERRSHLRRVGLPPFFRSHNSASRVRLKNGECSRSRGRSQADGHREASPLSRSTSGLVRAVPASSPVSPVSRLAMKLNTTSPSRSTGRPGRRMRDCRAARWNKASAISTESHVRSGFAAAGRKHRVQQVEEAIHRYTSSPPQHARDARQQRQLQRAPKRGSGTSKSSSQPPQAETKQHGKSAVYQANIFRHDQNSVRATLCRVKAAPRIITARERESTPRLAGRSARRRWEQSRQTAIRGRTSTSHTNADSHHQRVPHPRDADS